MPTVNNQRMSVKEIISAYKTDKESINIDEKLTELYKVKDKLCAKIYALRKLWKEAKQESRPEIELRAKCLKTNMEAVSRQINELIK